MFKLDLEKAEETEIKLPTSIGLSKKQESSRKTSISALLTGPPGKSPGKGFHDTGCLGLVHWDDPEGWYGESQHHSSKASILRCSAFFVVQLSHLYMTAGKTIPLTDGPLLTK